MKKFIIFGVVLALLVPSLAMAATEFTLGGFIKLDVMWDSDNGCGKNLSALPARNNDPNAKHGRLKFTAAGSRFSFTIKGPKLWGADVTGFIEMDFDSSVERGNLNTVFNTSNNYTPRLRHAMFRFNWPTSELLLGQYWSMFCEYYAESAEDGPLMMTGTPTARLAQIRFTQTFSGFTVAGMIGDPSNILVLGPQYGNANINNGQYSETPQVQGKISYAKDFWGKAAYYGKPTPFTIQFVGGYQRNAQRSGALQAVSSFGENNATATFISVRNASLSPWLAMGSLFIPVIPTQSANLAGTASILTQWWMGQGVEAFGFGGTSGAKYRFENSLGFGAPLNCEAQLLNKYGGFVEGQYYFNNQWFVNALYGLAKAYNVSRARWQINAVQGPGGMAYAFLSGNEPSTIQQASATLWYRPIQAIKFGLQYSYVAASYFQMATVPAGAAPSFGNNTTRFGDNHRVEFVGFFYF